MSPFLHNVVRLFSATVVAQGIALLSSFVLAKWAYPPMAFGDFSVFLSIVSVVSVVATLRIDVLVVLPAQIQAAEQLFLLALRAVLGVFLGCLAIAFLVGWYSGGGVFLAQYIGVALAIGLLGLQSIGISLLTKQGAFGAIATHRLLISASTFGFQYILPVFSQQYGLVLGYLLGMLLGSGYLYVKLRHIFRVSFKLEEALSILKSYQSIIQYGFPADLLNTIALNIHPFLIHHYFGATTAGWYFFAQRVLTTPVQVISSSVGQVYFQRMAALFQTDKSKMLGETLRIVGMIGGVVGCFLLGMAVFSRDIIHFIFGERWMGAVPFLLYLMPLVLVRSLVSPISSLAEVLNKTSIALIFNMYYLFGNIIAIYWGYTYPDRVHWVALLSWVGAPAYGVLLGFYLWILWGFSD
jgi:O-antigen/teichoic acid export membrane protein